MRLTEIPAIEPGTWRDNCSHCGGWKSTGCQRGCKYNLPLEEEEIRAQSEDASRKRGE
jgi:hypothetical protein